MNRMNGIDLMILAAIVAAFFWNILAVYTQKKWRLFVVFIGKKHAFKVQACLVTIVWLQVIGLLYIDAYSSWEFRGLWYLGVPLLLFAVWLFLSAVKELGIGPLFNANLFNYKVRKTGQTYARYRHPMYISFVIGLLAVGLCLGQYGMVLAIVPLMIGFCLLAVIESPPKKPIHI